MSRPTVEVADIVRKHGDHFLERNRLWLSYQHLKVLQAIVRCRTAALGGHIDSCSGCDHRTISYNSCRDRHCPRCQAQSRERWLAARDRELLGVPYFHVVFTLPHESTTLWRYNPDSHMICFRSKCSHDAGHSSSSGHFGPDIRFLRIRHTRGLNLALHPDSYAPSRGVALA